VASPPTTIVPLPVVIAEGRIPLASERVTTPVISDSHIASTIIGGVLCAVDREVTLAIDSYVITTAKLIRVVITIDVRVPCAIHRDVPFTICVEISGSVDRDVPIVIRHNVTSRVKLLCPLEVPITHPFVPREVSFSNRAQSGVVFDHGI
jgi:hypothetical protein